MDIEQHNYASEGRKSAIALQLQSLLHHHDFTLKKVLILLTKYGDRSVLIQELTEIYQHSNQLSALTNILMVLQHVLTQQACPSSENCARIRWLIEKTNEIRAQIDKCEDINESILETLNKLLKIMNNIVVYFGKLSLKNRSKLEETPVFQHEMMFIIQLSGQKMYNKLLNQLFDINLFLKILENRTNSITFNEFVNQTIIQQFNHLENMHQNCSQIVKEILLNTLIKSLKMIKSFDQFLRRNLASILTIFETKSRLRLLYELKQYNLNLIGSISCENQPEFQLLSLVIHEASQISQCDLNQLSEIWIKNLFILIQNDIQADLSSIFSEFNGSFLIVIYTKVSQLFSTGLNELQDKSRMAYIWCKLLLCDKMHEQVLQNKSILINVELLLHQFIREILGLLNPTIYFQLYRLILQVFSSYHDVILKQKECLQIRQRIITYIINRFPEVLVESMIFKDSTIHRNSGCINIEDYNSNFLNELVKQCLDSTTQRVSLTFLEKRVSKILLKYLIDNNIVSVTTLFNQNDIIAYTIQNDIEIHLDIYENLLQQKIYNDLQTYLSLVSKSHSKNRYRNMVDTCCLNMLVNELEDTSDKKLLKINQNMMNLLIENINFLFNITHEYNISSALFFNSLYSYITRSLYYNVPVTLNYLLIVTLALKHRTIGSQLLQNQVKLIHELVKFCKMYQGTHRSYYILGFISLTILLYGLPCQPCDNVIGLNVQQALNDQTIFLQPIIQVLSGETQIIDTICRRQDKRLKNEELFEISLKKCLNVGLIRHLSHILNGENHLEAQIKQFNNLIKEVMMSETSRIQKKYEKHSCDRNNRDDWTKYDDEQKAVKTQPQQKEKSGLQFVQQLLKQYDKYDQFSQYRKLQKQLSLVFSQGDEEHERLLQSERVHGKIRTIFHVVK